MPTYLAVGGTLSSGKVLSIKRAITGPAASVPVNLFLFQSIFTSITTRGFSRGAKLIKDMI